MKIGKARGECGSEKMGNRRIKFEKLEKEIKRTLAKIAGSSPGIVQYQYRYGVVSKKWYQYRWEKQGSKGNVIGMDLEQLHYIGFTITISVELKFPLPWFVSKSIKKLHKPSSVLAGDILALHIYMKRWTPSSPAQASLMIALSLTFDENILRWWSKLELWGQRTHLLSQQKPTSFGYTKFGSVRRCCW